MFSFQATSTIASQCRLGEGPVWFQQALWWVDIEDKCLLQQVEGRASPNRFSFPEKIGFAVPAKDETWRIGLQSGIYSWNQENDHLQRLHDPEPALKDNRFNDGKCDPMGRLWGGTMRMKGADGTAALYRITDSVCERILEGITVSNGLAWNPAKGKMYYIDTPKRAVFQYDMDPLTGDLSNEEIVIAIAPETGSPDGMTIDADGKLWVALWGGRGILNIDPDSGAVLGRIEVPALNVTSCTFGGENLETLFITTARIGMNDDQLAQLPESGNIFAVKPGCQGLPVDCFKTDP